MKISVLNEHNISPKSSKKIGIYNESSGKKVGFISIDKISKKYDKKLYSVGIISDVHYNDTDNLDGDPDTYDQKAYEQDGTEYYDDLKNALNYYNSNRVGFICCCGDISSDKVTHVVNFAHCVNKYSNNIPVLSCMGNHDQVSCMGNHDQVSMAIDTWNETTGPIREPIPIEYSPNKDSFFIVYDRGDKKDVYIFLSVNYNNGKSSATKTEDAIEDEDINWQYYDKDTLDWLEDVLNNNIDNRCFVFTHLFFRQKAGNNCGEGYKYYANGRSRTYCLRGHDFLRLNELNNNYLNTMWFSGHSHYPLMYQIYDKKINVCNYDSYFEEGSDENGIGLGNIQMGEWKCKSGYTIHVPSLTRPLKKNSDDYQIDGNRSEGFIMDVYEDYVDLRGIVFKDENGDYTNKQSSIATYRLYIK